MVRNSHFPLYSSFGGSKSYLPSVDIIIPSFNDSSALRQCLQSIYDLDSAYIGKVLIIDNLSSDGTDVIVDSFLDKLPIVFLKKASSIYEAMNIGISSSTADFLYFIGCDDRLLPGWDIAASKLDSTCPALLANSTSNLHSFPSFLSLRSLFVNTVHHQACFYNRLLLLRNPFPIFKRKDFLFSDYYHTLLLFPYRHVIPSLDTVICLYSNSGSTSRVSFLEYFISCFRVRLLLLNPLAALAPIFFSPFF
jgi:glycosyltransferase involved in cell wall biosynthesis